MKRTVERCQGIALRGRGTLRKAMEKPCWEKIGNAKEKKGAVRRGYAMERRGIDLTRQAWPWKSGEQLRDASHFNQTGRRTEAKQLYFKEDF